MRRALFTFLSATALLATGVVAGMAAGGTGTVEPPPRIAFLANGINPADALAAGAIAGQLGAPLFTTNPATLEDAARDGIAAYQPELLIVLGGTVAISQPAMDAAAAAAGLTVVTDADARPDAGAIRVAGDNRYLTAAVVAELLSDYDVAFLPADGTALGALDADEADTLDGKDSTDFALADQTCAAGQVVTGIAADGTPVCATDHIDGGNADTLDGIDASSLIRVAGHFDDANSTGSTYEANAVTITAPTAGYLHITSSTGIFNAATPTGDYLENADAINCTIELNGSMINDDGTSDIRLLANVWDRCAQDEVVAVPPGTHDVNVAIFNMHLFNTQVLDSRLSVLFTPFGEVSPSPTR